ncbi:fructose-6-phosphate aldolase [Clostridium sp. AM58-1XD]|nr:fructose-6-phosphate aldolase [Clostridium sp. AM58-1XD]RGZ00711.1 fructose-6-phosphate aldolase [Clostridium sp. AM58-1XD]
MEYLFDTANIEEIRKYGVIYPFTGVTSNPSILKKEGRIDFFSHFREIRSVIGKERSLHIQVTALEAEDIAKEAEAILQNVDEHVFIKIPVTEEGLKVMRYLKSKGAGITATAVYTKAQGYLAMEAGADYIAPYFNRMENMDIDAAETIGCFAEMIERWGYQTKILAASFKNMAQVNAAFCAGAHTATVQPQLLHDAMNMAAIGKAVDDFRKDWKDIFGDVKIHEMV